MQAAWMRFHCNPRLSISGVNKSISIMHITSIVVFNAASPLKIHGSLSLLWRCRVPLNGPNRRL
jgi:hypothetical protein